MQQCEWLLAMHAIFSTNPTLTSGTQIAVTLTDGHDLQPWKVTVLSGRMYCMAFFNRTAQGQVYYVSYK